MLLKPGIDRIRTVFDYERFGGSPLLGVKGTVIITHGRAKRRMIGFALGVAAASARARIPELIAETFQRDADRSPMPRRRRAGDRSPRSAAGERPARGRGSADAEPSLTWHAVVDELIRLAAMEVPGVVRVDRAGPLVAVAARRPIGRLPASTGGGSMSALAIVARPGHPLVPLTRAGP